MGLDGCFIVIVMDSGWMKWNNLSLYNNNNVVDDDYGCCSWRWSVDVVDCYFHRYIARHANSF